MGSSDLQSLPAKANPIEGDGLGGLIRGLQEKWEKASEECVGTCRARLTKERKPVHLDDG